MWRFPFINTGCLNATYYFSDRLGEARTQSVAGWNKITLQKLFLLLMICSGGACPRLTYHCRLASTWPTIAGLSHLTYHCRLASTWLTIAGLPPPGSLTNPAAERRPGMAWLSADSRHQGETQSNGTGLARQHGVQ